MGKRRCQARSRSSDNLLISTNGEKVLNYKCRCTTLLLNVKHQRSLVDRNLVDREASRIITGCPQCTNADYSRVEARLLPVKNFIEEDAAMIYSRYLNPEEGYRLRELTKPATQRPRLKSRGSHVETGLALHGFWPLPQTW